jgi:hypothetical protein
MTEQHAATRAGFVAAACTACCAPPIIGALGLTAGLAATVGVFLGLGVAIAVALVGIGWVVARRTRPQHASSRAAEPVPVAAPVRRDERP